MNRLVLLRCLSIAVVAPVAVAGCRGKFGTEACDSGDRIDVPAGAVGAIYYDNQGHPLGSVAEDMVGTEDNKMCPTEVPGAGGPGQCRKAGYCVVNIGGTDYCLKCP